MKAGQTGITRQDLRATVVEVMGSFAVVKTDTGTRYTVHEFEFFDPLEGWNGPAHKDAFEKWPRHNFRLQLVGKGSGKAKSLMITGDDKGPPMKEFKGIRFGGVRVVRGG